MTDITINATDGGSFTGYLAKPAKAKAPGLLLIQEIFGVNKVMRGLADEFAKQGYLVLCPDLFWRQQPDIQLTDQSEADWQKAMSLYQGFNHHTGLGDLIASLNTLRNHPDCSGKVGCTGYCLGGSLAYVMACNSDVDASVSYYGIGIAGLLDMAKGIKKPLLLHIAENDKFVPKEEQEKEKQALGGNKLVTIHSYPNVDHAFARTNGQTYDKQAADLANQRTAEFLKKTLA
jgi:carboxymethylenebutenolidase